MNKNTICSYAAPLGRVLISAIFLMSGLDKISNYAGTQQYMESFGVPGILIIPTILVEIAASIAVIIGWRARESAAVLAGFTILTTIFFHTNFSDQMQMIMFMKNLAIAGGFLMIMANGPGAFSLGKR